MRCAEDGGSCVAAEVGSSARKIAYGEARNEAWSFPFPGGKLAVESRYGCVYGPRAGG